MIIKKKVGENGKYQVVKDVVVFETPNKDLLEKVASESSKVLHSERNTQRNAPENFETNNLQKVTFELEVSRASESDFQDHWIG